jgi:peptide/nickel transport system permease protein
MRQYILKRLLQVIPTIVMITMVVFAMMQSIPGDPTVALFGDAYDAENAARLRAEYGLDKPIIVQYAIWLGKLVRGDWGESYLTGRSVLQEVLLRLPITVELIILAMGGAVDCPASRDYRRPAPEHLGRLHRHDLGPGGYFHP